MIVPRLAMEAVSLYWCWDQQTRDVYEYGQVPSMIHATTRTKNGDKNKNNHNASTSSTRPRPSSSSSSNPQKSRERPFDYSSSVAHLVREVDELAV